MSDTPFKIIVDSRNASEGHSGRFSFSLPQVTQVPSNFCCYINQASVTNSFLSVGTFVGSKTITSTGLSAWQETQLCSTGHPCQNRIMTPSLWPQRCRQPSTLLAGLVAIYTPLHTTSRKIPWIYQSLTMEWEAFLSQTILCCRWNSSKRKPIQGRQALSNMCQTGPILRAVLVFLALAKDHLLGHPLPSSWPCWQAPDCISRRKPAPLTSGAYIMSMWEAGHWATLTQLVQQTARLCSAKFL